MTTPPYTAVRVLICADDLLTRAGLSAILSDYGEIAVVGQVNPSDLDVQVDLYRPDVILWDVGWADEESAEQIARLVDDGLPILLLVPTVDNADLIGASGVQGLLLRDTKPVALVAALIALAQELYVSDAALVNLLAGTANRGMSTLAPAMVNALIEPLTGREMDVLQTVARGLSNKQIARDLEISEHTVKFHLNAILGKLGAQSRTEAVYRATLAGLIRL
ncbi:MAG: response regulator transcription factor [Caldilineaceae bacterium]